MTRSRFGPLAAAGASALILSALIAGCSSGATGATVASGGTIVQGGTIVYGHEQEPPCLYGGWLQQAYIDRNILDSLVTEANNGSIEPWLATSWTVSSNGLVYTFHLNPGVKFTDGTPLNAQAVAYNFNYWQHGGNSTAQVSMDPYYKSATALNATTVQVTLNKPYLPLLTMISQAYFGIQSPTALKRSAAANCDDPIGSGAFKVQKWIHGQEVILVRNPDYTSWPATALHKGPAIVDEVDWKFLPDPVERYESLVTGETNAIYDIPTVDWSNAEANFQVTQYVTPGKPVSIYLNTSEGIFTDVRVRQAFAYAADRKADVEAAFHGVIPYEGNPSVSRATPGYDASVAGAYPYDQAKAKSMLKSAGYPNGLTLKFLYRPSSTASTKAFQTLQADLAPAGIKLVGVGVPSADFYVKYLEVPSVAKGGAWDVSLAGWGPDWYGDAATSFFKPLFYGANAYPPVGSNFGFYNNPAVNSLITKAAAQGSASTAASDWAQLDQMVMKDAPIYPITQPLQPLYHASYVHNAVYVPALQGFDYTNVWLSSPTG